MKIYCYAYENPTEDKYLTSEYISKCYEQFMLERKPVNVFIDHPPYRNNYLYIKNCIQEGDLLIITSITCLGNCREASKAEIEYFLKRNIYPHILNEWDILLNDAFKRKRGRPPNEYSKETFTEAFIDACTRQKKRELTLEKAADLCFLSRSTFCRLRKKYEQLMAREIENN